MGRWDAHGRRDPSDDEASCVVETTPMLCPRSQRIQWRGQWHFMSLSYMRTSAQEVRFPVTCAIMSAAASHHVLMRLWGLGREHRLRERGARTPCCARRMLLSCHLLQGCHLLQSGVACGRTCVRKFTCEQLSLCAERQQSLPPVFHRSLPTVWSCFSQPLLALVPVGAHR